MDGIKIIAPRMAIRQKVCEILIAALPLWESRIKVYETRAIPLSLKLLPAVLVYTRDERFNLREGHADAGLRCRELELVVEILACNPDAEATVDFIASAVEHILDNNETLGNLVEGMKLAKIALDVDGEGEKIVIAARMDFELSYWTAPVFLPNIPEGNIHGALPVYMPPSAEDGALPEGGEDGGGETEKPEQPQFLILGMSQGLGAEPSDFVPHKRQILVSTTPFIGKEYEKYYEPAGTLG